MLKAKAIELLGGSIAAVAKAIGVSYQAVDKWPDELPPRIADRVLAALARKHWGDLSEPPAAPPDVAHGTAAKKAQRDQRDDQRDNSTDKRRSIDKPSHRKGR